MTKQQLHQHIVNALQSDLQAAIAAAQTAHETATHEENVAENKYDTRGLEAAYLAAGYSRRIEEIQQSLQAYNNLILRTHEAERGVQLSSLVVISDIHGREQTFFLGPAGAGLKIKTPTADVMVITPHAPLGQALMGKVEGDEVHISIGSTRQSFEVLSVK
ncbi:GreA/GreB family elongation factor [Pseudomonas asuensis]|uniref:Transcription elongation factor GreA/GreB C-terminal domain-containing protein n=1 Tax=Pseudomonas asuensis TaxID=1825787 RepID=A0ABQ2H1B4_9PSED|nr:GreA/GreB family elongation factor [Pseudomonas asuensis]GGM21092.1 hypothetical protein GCM10009425_35070 [Pseudomonas asuensis]